MQETGLTVVEGGQIAPYEQPRAAAEIKQQVDLIQQVMKAVMREGEHYGVIPGCNKPSLLQPGAQKLSVTFRLAPRFTIERKEHPNGHLTFYVACDLCFQSGRFAGQGVGNCSTLESKYRYRNAGRKCPICGKETIIKGQEQYGGGWLCYSKKGGCGTKWADGAEVIESQPLGKVENENIADTYNTVEKMAKKRAFVDAVLTATAASDIFTQDMEDAPVEPPVSKNSNEPPPVGKATPPPKQESQKPPQTPSPATGIDPWKLQHLNDCLDALCGGDKEAMAATLYEFTKWQKKMGEDDDGNPVTKDMPGIRETSRLKSPKGLEILTHKIHADMRKLKIAIPAEPVAPREPGGDEPIPPDPQDFGAPREGDTI
jgi:hypothetical protein